MPDRHPTAQNGEAQVLIAYLQNHLPAYPFDPDIDVDFVHELIQDFDHINLLEETKAFRWYYDNRPVERLRNVRLGLRRWLANAWTRSKGW